MPDFELRFTATPQLDPQADAKLKKQWDKLEASISKNIELRPTVDIPKGTFTKIRHQYVQLMNDLGKTPLEVKLNLQKLKQQLGDQKFDLLGLGTQYAQDLQKHVDSVRQLESEYVNLKAMMRDAAQTLEGDVKTDTISKLEGEIGKLGEKIKSTFSADEIEHFNRTMGELGGRGSSQVVGVQEFADSISGVRERIVELAGEGEKLVRVTQVFEDGKWVNTTTQVKDNTAKLSTEYGKLVKQVEAFEAKFDLSEGTFADRWKELDQLLKDFNVDAPDARKKLDEINKVFVQLQGDVSGSSGRLAAYRKTLNDITEAELRLQNALLKKGGVEDDETQKLREQVVELEKVAKAQREVLDASDKATQASNAEADATEKKNRLLSQAVKQYLKEHSLLSNIATGFKDATARVTDYTVAYRLMWAAISKIRQAIDVAQELNKAFTDIEMVTMGTAEATQKLRKEYADLAVEMSATVTQVAEGANEWLRQGKTAEETTSLIKASMVMSRIGAIESADATSYLTSVLNGYKIATEDVMHVVDAMSQVDIESASSVDDLAVALQRSASTASQAGVSFERLLGYVATVREVTQRTASVVGESMKTILSRIGSVKAGTFLSEDLESEYTDISTYVNDVEKVLSKVGIRLRDTNKDFRDAQDILDDVAKGWANYDDLTKQALATAIAGTRQRESFLALMSNYDKALKLENSALNSNGKAMQKYSIYQDGIAAKQDRITAFAQTWVQNLNVEGIISPLLSVAEAFMKIFSNQVVVNATKIVALISSIAVGIVNLKKILSTTDAVAKLIAMPKVILAVVAAVTALVYIFDKLHKSSAELSSELQSLNDEYDQSVATVEGYNQQIQENINKIDELQALISAGTGGIVEQGEIDKLKEENKELERNIKLEKLRQDAAREQATRDARELYERGYKYTTSSSVATSIWGGMASTGTETYDPEEILSVAQANLDRLKKAYDKDVEDGFTARANHLKDEIEKKEDELYNTIIPWVKQLATAVDENGDLLYQGVADAYERWYNSTLTYAEKISNVKVEHPDAYNEFGKIVAENSEQFQAYLEGDDEALNGFSDILTGRTNPAIYLMIQAMNAAGINLTELIRYLLNAANAGEDFSDSIKLETPAQQIEKFKDKVAAVVAAEEELADSGYVSADAAADLAEAYGDDVYNAMVWTSKGYKISRSELESLIEKQKESYAIALNDAKRAATAVIQANGGKAASWNVETASILANIKAVEAAKLQQLALMRGADKSTKDDAVSAYNEIKEAEESLANAQENYDNLLKTLDYLRTSSTTGSSKKSDAETAYEREIRLLEHELYLSEQISDVYKNNDDEINYRKEVNKQLEIYKNLMDAVHAEADRLRAKGYKDTSEEIQKLQQAWWGYYNERRDLQQGLSDWEKQNAEDTAQEVEDALSKVKDAINDLLDEAQDKLDEKLDELEAKIKKNEAIKALHESFFGILNEVADGMHEIDKELEASMSSADYLDESLRQAMFNEDDYKKISSKLNEIADESRVLFDDYLAQLEMLTEDEIYKADYITNEFERQYEYKKLEYEVAQKELALAKAQTKLQNTLANRNVRMYKNGQWIWTADYSAVEEAKKEVRDAEYEERDAEIKLKQQDVIDKYASIIDGLNKQKDAAEAQFDALKKQWERVQKQLTTEEDAMTRLLKAINETDIPEFKDIIKNTGGALEDLIKKLGELELEQEEIKKWQDENDPNIERWESSSGTQHGSGYGIDDSFGTKSGGSAVSDDGGKSYSVYDKNQNYIGTVNAKTGEISWGGDKDAGNRRDIMNEAVSEIMGSSSSSGGSSGSSGSSSSKGSSGTGTSSSGGSSNKGSSGTGTSSGKGTSVRDEVKKAYEESAKTGKPVTTSSGVTVNANKKKYDSGGILRGVGGIKATTADETVFGPGISSKILSPQKSKEFLASANALTKMLDNSSALNAMLNRFSDIVTGGNSVSNDSHDIYLGGNPLGSMTKADSFALTSVLRRYVPISGGGR